MTNKTVKAIVLFFSAVTLLTLSGCFADKSFNLSRDFQGEIEDPVAEESDDPDMKLVQNEEEVCLDQELDALSKSGLWTGEQGMSVKGSRHKVVKYDFPVVMNRQVEAYIKLFQTKQRTIFSRWLARSSRYVPYMQAELQKAGLPKDLAYLSMIESGFNQRACSRAQAVGLWQFMQATGRQYNLKVDDYLDERRDFEKSTAAAIAFLNDLYADFGDWHLAVAAYNAGAGRVRSGMNRYNVDNFWDLATKDHLHLETKRYVPKLIAAIIISKDPEKYGFSQIDYAPPFIYDQITVGPGLSLDALALISGSDVKMIKELNPQLRKAATPQNLGEYSVKIPAGSLAQAEKNINRLHRYVSTGYLTHKIAKNDTVRKICAKYNINTTTLLKVNNLRSSKLVAGTNLRIPHNTVKYQLLPEGSDKQLAAYKDNLILHTIKKGETVGQIAMKYGVPADMIVSWNGIKSVKRIRAGQQLALYISHDGEPAAPAGSAPETNVITARTHKIVHGDRNEVTSEAAVASSPATLPVLTASKKKAPSATSESSLFNWYMVKNGDSIWEISRKFKISTADIRKWNNLDSNLIHPGSRLKLK